MPTTLLLCLELRGVCVTERPPRSRPRVIERRRRRRFVLECYLCTGVFTGGWYLIGPCLCLSDESSAVARETSCCYARASLESFRRCPTDACVCCCSKVWCNRVALRLLTGFAERASGSDCRTALQNIPRRPSECQDASQRTLEGSVPGRARSRKERDYYTLLIRKKTDRRRTPSTRRTY